MTFNLGFLWKPSPQWSLGGFYRQAPESRLDVEAHSGPALEPTYPDGTLLFSGSGPLQFPDSFGLGIAYKSGNEALTVGFEWDRIRYSSSVAETLGTLDVEGFELDDGDEFHVGVEYVFVRMAPILAFRAGVWRDPDHRQRYVGRSVHARAIFLPGNDTTHYAFGLGLAFAHFQVDLGIDVSELVDTASVSAILSF